MRGQESGVRSQSELHIQRRNYLFIKAITRLQKILVIPLIQVLIKDFG